MADKEDDNTTIDKQIETNQSLTRRFDGVEMAHNNAATQALIAKETATIQARWIMAVKMPRSMANVRALVLKEMERPGFPEIAIYRVPRAGNTIKGLTIRTAEVMMRCMGNMSCDAQTLFDSPTERVIRVTAVDYEVNASWSRDITIKKTIERKFLKPGTRAISSRINSSGEQVFLIEAGDDDFRTKEAAEISKAARTAILRIIPGHIQDEAFDKCDNLFEKKIATNPDEYKNKVCDSFATLNVMPSELERCLGHGLDTASPAEISMLQNLFAAIRGGDGVWAEMCETVIQAREARKARGAPVDKAAAAVPTKSAEAKPATTTGKGTEAAKAKIKGDAKPSSAPATATVSSSGAGAGVVDTAPKVEPKPEPTKETAPPPSKEPEPVLIKPGHEERNCTDCGAVVEVPKSDPEGTLCYACAANA